MDDPISRQAAIDAIEKERKRLYPELFPPDAIGDFECRLCASAIRRLPSAQPKIIHCRECRWRNDYGHWLGCPVLNTDDDNYCSFAERITDG